MTGPASAKALHPAAEFLSANHATQRQWTVLDTSFGHGQSFGDIRQCWRALHRRPAMLHYVAAVPSAVAPKLQQVLAQSGTGLTEDLASLCWGLGQGFHRFLLEGGALSLTLCVGDLPDVLAQQAMQADVVLARAASHWDSWLIKATARHCKRGSALFYDHPSPIDSALLACAGFVEKDSVATERFGCAVYNPHWTLRNNRRPTQVTAQVPGTCAVIGAGIAGASVAHALALREWKVHVFDAQPVPAGGASGLPVGLVVPHQSADDSPRSRMSRAGTRLLFQHASALQDGQDWSPCGVLERRESDELWHPHAAWIKPHRLVAHWLGHPGIAFHGNCRVRSLERQGAQWVLHFAVGTETARADTVVFANAFACVGLLQQLAAQRAATPAAQPNWIHDVLGKLQAMQPIHGTLSMGKSPPDTPPTWPTFPVNGHGSFVPGVPTEKGPGWYAGSTFRSDALALTDLHLEHAVNWAKLHTLLPGVADKLSAQFANHQVDAWQGTRCVTHDRLPLVGPLEDGANPTLWLIAGMGARGLSFSALCAELIAAWIGAEPLPIESPLAQGLSTRRRRRTRTAASLPDQGALDSMQV